MPGRRERDSHRQTNLTPYSYRNDPNIDVRGLKDERDEDPV
jgi:hypothetical protein